MEKAPGMFKSAYTISPAMASAEEDERLQEDGLSKSCLIFMHEPRCQTYPVRGSVYQKVLTSFFPSNLRDKVFKVQLH